MSRLPSKGARVSRALENVTAFLLLALVIAGVVVRCIDLPLYASDSGDELANTIAPFRVLYEGGDPAVFFHPSLYYDVAALAYLMVFLALKLCGVIGWTMSMTDVFYANQTVFTFTARGVSVLASALSMWVLFALARSLWGRQAGLMAAALLAVFPLHVLYSLAIRVDSLFVLAFVYAVSRIVRMMKQPSRRTYLTAGAFVGLALGANYNGVVLVPWLLAAHFIGKVSSSSSPTVRDLAAALAVGAVVFFVTSPFIVFNATLFSENIGFIWGLATSLHPGWGDRGAVYYAHRLWQVSPSLTGLIVAAALAIVAFGNKTERFVLSIPFGYVALFSLLSSKDERFILPGLVLLLLVAAGAPAILWRSFGARVLGVAAVGMSYVAIFAAIGGMASVSFRTSLLHSHPVLLRPDRRVLDWIETHAPPHSNIVVESGLLPLVEMLKAPGRFATELRKSVSRVRPNLDQHYVGAMYVAGCSYDPGGIVRGEVDYVVISRRNVDFIEKNCGTYPQVCAFYAEVRARGKIVFDVPNEFEPVEIFEIAGC